MKKVSSLKKTLLALVLALTMLVPLFVLPANAASSSTITVGVTGTYNQTEAYKMLAMVNNFRTSSPTYKNSSNKNVSAGKLGTLKYDSYLEQLAMQRCAEIALQASHDRPNGQTTSAFQKQYILNKGYTKSAENLAWGTGTAQDTAKEAFANWKEDGKTYAYQGHRRNMLGNFNRIGIAFLTIDGITYWVQEFGYSSSTTNVVTAASGADGEATTNVSIKKSYIKSQELVLPESYSLGSNKTVDLPDVYARITTTGQKYTKYGSQAVKFAVAVKNATWSSSNTSVASISDGKLKTGFSLFGSSATLTVKGTLNGTVTGTVPLSVSLFNSNSDLTSQTPVPTGIVNEYNRDAKSESGKAKATITHMEYDGNKLLATITVVNNTSSSKTLQSFTCTITADGTTVYSGTVSPNLSVNAGKTKSTTVTLTGAKTGAILSNAAVSKSSMTFA